MENPALVSTRFGTWTLTILATILAEAIQALVVSNQVEANDVAGETISAAVDTVIAQNLWDEKGTCPELHVASKLIAKVEAAMPGSGNYVLKNFGIEAFKLAPGTPRAPPAAPNKIIAHVTFGH